MENRGPAHTARPDAGLKVYQPRREPDGQMYCSCVVGDQEVRLGWKGVVPPILEPLDQRTTRSVRVDLTHQHAIRAVLVAGPEITIPVGTRFLVASALSMSHASRQ
jgi:hypothetical protein